MTKGIENLRRRATAPLAKGLAALVLGLQLRAAPGLAQEAEADPYMKAVETALSEMALGNFLEAYSHFERAHRIAPSARTLRGLGVVSFELKRYVDAERFLMDALASNVRPLEADMRGEVQKLLVRTREYLGTLVLRGLPDDGELKLDDRPMPRTEDGRYRLNLGDHRLAATAPGRPTEQRSFRIVGGETMTIELPLAVRGITTVVPSPAEVAATSPHGPVDEPRAESAASSQADDGTVWESPWLWTTVGVVVAGAVVGTVLATSGTSIENAPTSGGSTGVTLRGL